MSGHLLRYCVEYIEQIFFLLFVSGNILKPEREFSLQPSIISLHILLDALVPLLEVLFELLAYPLLELHLLDVQPQQLDCVDDFDVGERLFASHVRVDVQLEPSNIVHILVVYFGLLHLVVEYAILEGLEDLVAHIYVDVQLLDVGQQIHSDQLALRLLDLLQVL